MLTSETKTNKTTLVKNLVALFLIFIGTFNVGFGQISESFDSGLPTSYNSTLTTLTLGSGSWQVRNVIAGTIGIQSGTKSAQIKSATNAQIITPTLTGGVGTISFYVTASTASGAYVVNISTDNGISWSPAPGSPFTIGTTKTLRSISVNNSLVNKIQIIRTSATIYIDDFSATLFVPTCTAPTALAFEVQPSNVVQNATMTSIKVKAICAGGATATTFTGPINLKLNDGCGFEYNGTVYAPGADITVNAIAGVATFPNIKFLRSSQSNLNFTASSTGLSSITSNNFDVTPSVGAPSITTIIQNDFDANTAWGYPSVVSTTYGGSGGGVSEVGIVSQAGTNVLRKRHTVNNGSGETGSQSVVTFDNVTGLSVYDELSFFFNVLSFGSGDGAGNDKGEDFWLDVSTNNGSTWTTILTEEGLSNRLFVQSASPVTALSLSTNVILNSGTKSAFKISLTGISQFSFRFTAKNNRSQENWAIDNVKLVGTTYIPGSPFNLPTAEIESESAICNDGSGIQLSLDVASFQPTLTYAWTPAATLNNSSIQNPIAHPTTATQLYTVIVTDGHYCKATDNILVINPGFGGTPGLWTGEESTDWFDCRNWSDQKVPTTATDVVINQTGVNECIIDEHDAVCNSLLLTTNNNTNNNLTLTTTGTLIVSNDVSIIKTGGIDIIELKLLDVSSLICRNLLIDGQSTGDAKLNHELSTTLVTVNGNLTIEPDGELDLSDGNTLTLNDGTLILKGNFTNNATESDFKQGESHVILNGIIDQHISIAGTNKEIFYNLTIDKNSGTVILADDVRIQKQLFMISGNINTQASILELGENIGASEKGLLSYTSGFVVGKMRRWFDGTNSGNATGLYPMGFEDLVVGSGLKNRHARIEFTNAPTSGGHLTVEYIGTPMTLDGIPILMPNTGGAPFDVTTTEDQGYWKMDNEAGKLTNAAYTITCTGEGYQNITDLSKLTLLKRVVANDPNWFCPGVHIPATGTNAMPTVSRSGVSNWSNFGFGGGTGNPLPVELTAFQVSCEEDQIQIQWSTASELNSSHFEVEKSNDLINWNLISETAAAGNSNINMDYQTSDIERSSDVIYYRLKQVDLNGESKVYGPISTLCEIESNSMKVYPNPTQGEYQVEINWTETSTNAQLQLLDLTGKVIDEMDVNLNTGTTHLQFNQGNLPMGTYLIRLNNKHNIQLTPIRLVIAR